MGEKHFIWAPEKLKAALLLAFPYYSMINPL
jgi:hypothetical protein